MQNEILFSLRLIFMALFVGTLIVGGYLFTNYQKLFGVDPNMPSENGSSRAYRKVQVFAVWAHAVALTGAFAFMLH